LALSISVDQPLWATAVTRLEVGYGRPFFEATLDTVVADLRYILTPQCVTRVREVAAQMATPAESVTTAADLMEEAVRLGPS
jgi:UDP:flavonoid glycosyltransferase YjiC (YdhE family)